MAKFKTVTIDLYKRDITIFMQWLDILDMNIKDSTFSDLAAYVEELRLMAIQETNKKLKGKIWGSYYRVFNSFTSPVDLYYDGRLIRKKSFTRGYATTVHKS